MKLDLKEIVYNYCDLTVVCALLLLSKQTAAGLASKFNVFYIRYKN
jgi:hypothetical protein